MSGEGSFKRSRPPTRREMVLDTFFMPAVKRLAGPRLLVEPGPSRIST